MQKVVRTAILVSTLLFLGSSQPPNAPALKGGEYEAIRDLSLQMLRKFPEKSHFYVGLGRSPTPIVGFLQAFSAAGAPIQAMNLPWSTTRETLKNNPLSPDAEADLFKHFERVLPSAERLQGKTLLVMDFSVSGMSLFSAHDYLSKYFKLKGISAQVKILAFVPKEQKSFVRSNARRVSKSVSILGLDNKAPLTESLYGSKFKGFAEFEPYTPGKTPKPSVSSEEYARLKKEFAQKIDKDPVALKYQIDICKSPLQRFPNSKKKAPR